MNTKKLKAIVYPYDVQFAPVLRHRGLIENVEIVGAVSPFSMGLCEKDAGKADKGEDMGIIVEENFTEMLDKCDTVIFCETEMKCDFIHIVYPKILEAIDTGKNIIMTIKLSKNTHDNLMELCSAKGVSFSYMHSKDWEKVKLEPDAFSAHIINEIDVPVVFVLGDGEKSSKFETQLSLREQFVMEGYKVSQIGSREYCELLGFHSIPTFMFEPRYEMEKIYLFNEYVKTIELKENPDVIIIGIPGAIMGLNNSNSTYCGITAYEISNAVSADAAVFCLYNMSWGKGYFEEVRQVIKHKFGFEVDDFVLSNTKIDWMGMSESRNRMYTFGLNRKKVETKKKELSDEQSAVVYDILNNQDATELYNDIKNKLVSYAEVEYF